MCRKNYMSIAHQIQILIDVYESHPSLLSIHKILIICILLVWRVIETNLFFSFLRRDHTCYKKTSLASDWRSARRQCWSMGGELAFPLDQKSAECKKGTYISKKEEVGSWEG